MPLAPLAYIILFELVRPAGAVPTVGAIRLDNTYGVLAFLVGRGFQGLVALLPLILGAGVAAFLTRINLAGE